MDTNINLLLRTDESELRKKRRIKALNILAIILLFSIGLISLSSFILIQIINPESIRKQQAEVLQKISKFQNRQAKLLILNNRIENIDKILKTRKDLARTINTLLAKMPNGLTINTFDIDDKFVIIAAKSRSLHTIGEFMNNLTDMVRKKEVIKSLTLSSLVLNEDNTYQISVKSEL